MNLSADSKVVVTGGASGLGRELCLAAAEREAEIWVTDIDLEGANETARLCRERGASRAVVKKVDVRHAAELQQLAAEANADGRGVDLLANNAGVAVAGRFEEQSLENWRWIVDINLWGVIHGCHYFLPYMKERKRGAILNIASAAGLLSPPELASYNTTKAAVVALSETLRAEYGCFGIRVAVVCPTFFETKILASARIASEARRKEAQKFFDRAQTNARAVALACLRGIERNSLYVLPSWDARMFWACKRASPLLFSKALSSVVQRALGQR